MSPGEPSAIATNTELTTIPFNRPLRRVAVVGTEVIAASWAAYELSRDLDVFATDPAPNAEANLHNYVDNTWVAIAKAGFSSDASCARLGFTASMGRALAESDLVQEDGPQRHNFKIKLFAEMDRAAPPDAMLASSSSSILASSGIRSGPVSAFHSQ